MTSAISGAAMGILQRPDPTQMASKLFSRLDTKNQGYIEKSDLQSALSRLSDAGNSDAGADEVFKRFDSDSDGKITKDEMASGFKKLAEALDSHFNRMRIDGFSGQNAAGAPPAMGGTPPPPPRVEDAGFSKEELSSQRQEIGSSDSQRSSLIGKIVDNFDAADRDGDGKVSFQEAMAYDQSSRSPADAGTSTRNADGASPEARIMQTIMQLMHSYGSPDQAAGRSGPSRLFNGWA